MSMKILAASLAAVALIAGATPALAKPRENVEVRVSTAGINFNDAESVAKFRARVARAVADVCNPGDRVNADMAPDFACRKSMAQTSETRIAALQAKSNAAMAIVE
jgi:UrcA family protein